MKTKLDEIINLIENLIAEHENEGYCTDFDEAETSNDNYDSGRYETLVNLLYDIKKIAK
jgi:hypothetical protein